MRTKNTPGKLAMAVAVVGIGSVGCAQQDNQEESAEGFPEEAVSVTVPFDPGGGSDVMARLVEQHWDEEFDVGLEFDYVSGAGGTVGMSTFLSTADEDGHDIITFNYPHIVVHPSGGLADYHWSDYSIIGQISEEHTILVVRDDSPYETLDDFVSDVDDSDGTVSTSIPQAMDAGHIAYTQFEDQLDSELPLVAYQSGSEQLDGVLSGDVDSAFGTVGTMISGIEGGELRVLAVATDERLDTFPDWETFAEHDYEVISPLGRLWLAPEGVSEERIDRLAEGFANIAEDQEFVESMENMGVEAEFIGRDELIPQLEDLEETVDDLVAQMEDVEE